MTKDIGIVLLPNSECNKLALTRTTKITEQLIGYTQAKNTPHITLLHIANQDESHENRLKVEFENFYSQITKEAIDLPIDGYYATAGNGVSGYKWLDLAFNELENLKVLRHSILDKFCSFHNGTLTRMNDDMASYTEVQKEEILKCGVVIYPYKPHITLWYIDIPNEERNPDLRGIANSFNKEELDVTCYAEQIALVELGRNGNAFKVIDAYSLTGNEEL